ncbi:hypothetical protein TSUD_168890 [Trifolium subterraneum]|nr:hypothetical protein TSUD_168890 [Trifolium subterraneum]
MMKLGSICIMMVALFALFSVITYASGTPITYKKRICLHSKMYRWLKTPPLVRAIWTCQALVLILVIAGKPSMLHLEQVPWFNNVFVKIFPIISIVVHVVVLVKPLKLIRQIFFQVIMD